MGRSAKIEELAKENEAFRKYLDEKKGDLQKDSENARKEMDEEIEKFYKENDYKKENYISGMNSDFMQEDSWSLDNVNKIISGIQKAMFGEAKPPEGTKVETKTSTELSKSITAMTDLKTYIIGRSFDIISAIVESFGASTSVAYHAMNKHEPLGNGFHLFTMVASDSYSDKSYFKNKSIYEYLYIYKVCFSVGEAISQGKMMAIELYENQIALFKDKLEGYGKKLELETITVEQYIAFRDVYEKLMAESQAKLNELEKAKAIKEHAERLKAKE